MTTLRTLEDAASVAMQVVEQQSENPSLWERLTENPFFCAPETCGENCQGDFEEDDEFKLVLFEADEFIKLKHSYAALSPAGKVEAPIQSRGQPQQFSLPWADLNGNKKENLVTSAPGDRAPCEAKKMGALLPCSTGSSTGKGFNDLYRPIFLNGVPIKAYVYKPDEADPIDVAVARALRTLIPEASKLLALLRLGPGKYEIEARIVSVYWAASGLLVHETGTAGPNIDDMPLQAYINLAASVALDLQKLAMEDSSSQVLDSFFDGGARHIHDPTLDGEDRYCAMQQACMQAKMREMEAERQLATKLGPGASRNPIAFAVWGA